MPYSNAVVQTQDLSEMKLCQHKFDRCIICNQFEETDAGNEKAVFKSTYQLKSNTKSDCDNRRIRIIKRVQEENKDFLLVDWLLQEKHYPKQFSIHFMEHLVHVDMAIEEQEKS